MALALGAAWVKLERPAGPLPPPGSAPASPVTSDIKSQSAAAPTTPAGLPRSTAADPMLKAVVKPVPCDLPELAAPYERAVAAYYQERIQVAVEAFRQCVREAPDCALVHAGLSKALLRARDVEGARRESQRANDLLEGENDRARRIAYAWWWHMKGVGASADDAQTAFERERSILDYAIVLFPADPDLWVLRAEASDTAISAAPFYYIARRLAPENPGCRGFTMPAPPPVPDLPLVRLAKLGPSGSPPTLFEGLGNLTHRVSTSSPMAQKYYEQGLRCFHAYVTPSTRPDSAARCFHHAIALDPHMAMAYWGLSFCLGTADAIHPRQAAATAYHLAMQLGSDRERRYAAARVLELAGPSMRSAFIHALDSAILAYPTDVELWIWRGKIYGQYGAGSEEDMTLSEKVLAGMPFALAAHLLEPDHPSPNHELIHTYEQIDRPALGWPYTDLFRDAAPNMPHANHMQAHLAMRLGRWDDALAAARRTVLKAREGFPELDPGHHLYVLALALAHEGRFAEAEELTFEARPSIAWARLLRLKSDHEGLRRWVEDAGAGLTLDVLYVKVLVELDEGRVEQARSTLSLLERARSEAKISDNYKLREARARVLCATGRVAEGLKLFKETSWTSLNDGSYHFFGGGGYFPEVWGEEALRRGELSQAEVAFHEALAHEHGSIVGALGLQVVSERRKDAELARHYARRAARIWKNADPGFLERQLARLRALSPGPVLLPPLPLAPATVRPFARPAKGGGP